MRFTQKSRAVISVFLIIVMMPLLGLAVVLVDGSRVQSANMMVQEASDLAAISTLAGYNNDLKNDYGLFAVKNPDNAGSIYESFLKSSLTEAAGGDQEYSDKLYNAVKGLIFKDSKINGFTDLFNYSIGTPNVETLYSLDQKEVLQNQIVEYTKYRGVYFLADRLSLLSKMGDLKKEQEDTKKSAELMDKKLSIDEEAAKNVEEKIAALNKKISEFHNAVDASTKGDLITGYVSTARSIIDAAENAYDKNIKDENWPSDLSVAYNVYMNNGQKTGAINNLQSQCNNFDNLGKVSYEKFSAIKKEEVEAIIESINSEKGKLNSFLNDTVNKSDTSVSAEMRNDIADTLAKYEKYLAKLNALKDYLNGEEYKKDEKHLKISSSMYGNAYSAICKSLLDENNSPAKLKSSGEGSDTGNASPMQYFGLVVKNNEFRSDGQFLCKEERARKNYYGTVDDGCPYYSKLCSQIKTRMVLLLVNEPNQENHQQEAENIIKEANNKKVEYSGGAIPDSEYSLLPSKGEHIIDEVKTEYSTDTSKIADQTHSILSNSSNFLSDIGTVTRDEALTYAYIFGMFKTRMTDSEKFCSAKKPSSWSSYHVQWRYEHDDGEHDLRERAKSGQDSALNAEVEYIFSGNKSDSKNCAAVYTWIFGTRVANNIAAVYANSYARKQCYELAVALSAAIAAASFGTVVISPHILQWIFITAWALAETFHEMNFLIKEGYKIPLIKTGNNLMIHDFFAMMDVVSMKKHLDENVKKPMIDVCYEDYLLILMCIMTSSETRVRRVADLVQLNMRKRHDGEFMMNKAPTYIKAETDISMSYLFQQFSQFSSFYPGAGIHFKNTIYQGY